MAAVLLALEFLQGAEQRQGINVARKSTRWLGAQVCMGMLSMEQFQSEFARWDISTRIN
jgi:hypothetical protein